MDVYKNLDWEAVEKLKISSGSKIVLKRDLNFLRSEENISVQFLLDGEVKGSVDCHLCLDNKDIDENSRNYLYPYFTESMNILLGRLISTDPMLSALKIKLSPPKCTIYSKTIDSRLMSELVVYSLVINDFDFDVVLNLNLTVIN